MSTKTPASPAGTTPAATNPQRQPTADGESDSAGWRRLAIEAGPLAAFFLVNSFFGIMWGTGVFMVATTVSVIASIRLERRWPIMPMVSCFFVLLFGGLTLALNDDLFIKLKPTIVNTLFAAVLFVGLAIRRPLLKIFLGALMSLTNVGWRILMWRWALFFLFLAVLNEVVWRTMSTDFWVSFKLFGVFPLTLLFSLAQIPLMQRHHPAKAAETPR